VNLCKTTLITFSQRQHICYSTLERVKLKENRLKLKILGVTVTNSLSVAEHVQNIIKLSSQTLHALRILRSHGMSATVIQHVFRAVVVAKLSYASQGWSGFTSAADLRRINAFLRRCIRQKFCSPDLTDPLFPSEVCTFYQLRPRRHNRQLIPKVNKLRDSNFIQRMLYKDSY